MTFFHPLAVAFIGITAVVSAAAAAPRTPSNHPPISGLSPEQLRAFASNLNCPYAAEWLTKGPERASRDIAERQNARARARARRRVEELLPEEIAGSCTYDNPWTSSDACMEFRGTAWTVEQMTSKCAEQANGDGGTLSIGSEASNYCAMPASGEKLAGWCVTKTDAGGTMVVASPMTMSGDMSCAAVGGACTSFAGGDAFVNDGACASSDEEKDAGKEWTADAVGGGGMFNPPAAGAAGGSDGITCEIAPGPAGAAHQAPFSSGYRSACPGTPTESSPYQWPLRWTADVESKSVSYTSDTTTYVSKSKVWYRLDKNWKRMDSYRQKGVVPFFSRSTEDDDFVDKTERRTMIHRGGKMWFLTYNNDTLGDDVSNIKDCGWLDLSIVGNIRPDWYLDARGGATDAQYIGNQHVYYPGADGVAVDGNGDLEELTVGSPRLVKQWRKKDFASQYFTMSMKEHTGDDGIHWPLILNIPGEGFGDDMLQFYSNQELLSEDFIEPFLLDEAFEAAGGQCIDLRPEGRGERPEMDYVPSNLEIDDSFWSTNVWTGSPVWEPPPKDGEDFADSASAIVGDLATTDAGPSTVVTSCYDESSKAVELSITYSDLTAGSDGSVPWLGLSFRKDEQCVMTPRDGSDAEVALVLTDEFGALSPLHFMMAPSTKGAGMAAGRNTLGYTPLEDKGEYTDVKVTHSDEKDSVTLKFSKAMDSAPEIMHLTYAIGSSSTFGYHNTRTCFDVEAFPACPSGDGSSASAAGMESSGAVSSYSAMFGLASAMLVVGVAAFASIN